jgi:hypothetical protein
MKRSERGKAKESSEHRLISRRRTHQGRSGEERRPERPQQERDEGPVPERGFVIGPVEGGSDVNLDPAKYLGG